MSVPHVKRTLALVTTAALAAAGGGTGGGGIFTPLALLSTGSVRLAVPLSKASVLGTATAALLINVRKKHPRNLQVPLMNFTSVALLEPATLAGAIFGVVLNSMVPNCLVVLLLFVVLLLSFRHTVKRAVSIYHDERRDRPTPKIIAALEWMVNATSFSSQRQSLTTGEPLSELVRTQSTECDEDGNDNDRRRSLLEDKGNQTISVDQSVIYGLLPYHFDVGNSEVAKRYRRRLESIAILTVIIDSLLGWLLLWQAGGPRALVCGTWVNQALLLFTVVLHLSVSLLYTEFLLREVKTFSSLNTAVEAGGFNWVSSRGRLWKFCLIGFLAGVSAGALGIGGGLLKGPLLLEMGLHPMAASATSTFMVFFTSGSNTLSYWLQARISTNALVAFFAAGLAGGTLGLHAVYMLVRKLKLHSTFAFFLAAFAAASLAALLVGESVTDAHVPYVC